MTRRDQKQHQLGLRGALFVTVNLEGVYACFPRKSRIYFAKHAKLCWRGCGGFHRLPCGLRRKLSVRNDDALDEEIGEERDRVPLSSSVQKPPQGFIIRISRHLQISRTAV